MIPAIRHMIPTMSQTPTSRAKRSPSQLDETAKRFPYLLSARPSEDEEPITMIDDRSLRALWDTTGCLSLEEWELLLDSRSTAQPR